MKHAKRMVLVPEDLLQRYEQRLNMSPVMANMVHKDMSNIPQRTYMDDAEKQKLYHATLERYLDLKHEKDSHIPTVRMAPGNELKQNTQLPDVTIVKHIPKTMRSKAIALLNRLKVRPDIQ